MIWRSTIDNSLLHFQVGSSNDLEFDVRGEIHVFRLFILAKTAKQEDRPIIEPCSLFDIENENKIDSKSDLGQFN